jgi:hypothetical protein
MLLVGIPNLRAQWTENGILLCTAAGNEYAPEPTSDGSGGAIIAFTDSRDDVGDIYAQRIDAHGNILWAADGVAVCTAAQDQSYPQLVSDGAGGAIITWADERSSSNPDLYAQRVDANGNPLWTADGVPIAVETNSQYLQQIISDGAGGAIIAWADTRGSLTADIYAQRIDSSGTVLWTANGVVICTDPENQNFPELAPDGAGGAIITWQDWRSTSSYDIYAQRINADGNVQWTGNGVAVCTVGNNQQYPKIVADGSGGTIIVWQDHRGGNWDIYAQKLAMWGNALWATDGIAICAVGDGQRFPRITSDGAGGAIITWEDYRDGAYYDIYAQRIDLGGSVLWTAGGIVISAAVNHQSYPRIISDDDGGAIIIWWDYRMGSASDIYTQRVDASGSVLWTANGVPLCTNVTEQENPQLTSDGAGGAIVVWQDNDYLDYSVHAQRIERNGYWGYPAPRITDVRDVPGDEGGYVNLAWDASRLDPWPEEAIARYTIWRAISPTAAAFMIDHGASVLECASEYDPKTEGPVVRAGLLGTESYYWELVSTLTAYYLESYSHVVPTLFDSTATSDEYHYFQVIAHGRTSEVYWISEPDSGYSVDNLSPCPPMALAGEQQHLPEGLLLTWDPNSEPDLDGYAVYRGLTEDFEPDQDNRIASLCDTFAFDGDWRWDSYFYYKVSAIDVHGNESPYAVIGPKEITGEETPDVPLAYFLKQNMPNPFNPSTTIRYGLKEPGYVRLSIYDASGRLVHVLVNEHREAGPHEVVWHGQNSSGRQAASGVYFYKLHAGRFKETKKMILLR